MLPAALCFMYARSTKNHHTSVTSAKTSPGKKCPHATKASPTSTYATSAPRAGNIAATTAHTAIKIQVSAAPAVDVCGMFMPANMHKSAVARPENVRESAPAVCEFTARATFSRRRAGAFAVLAGREFAALWAAEVLAALCAGEKTSAEF